MRCPTCGNDPAPLINGQFLVNQNALNGAAQHNLVIMNTNCSAADRPIVIVPDGGDAGCAPVHGLVHLSHF